MLTLNKCSMPTGGTEPETSTILRAASACFSTSTEAKPALETRHVVIQHQGTADAADQRFHVAADFRRRLDFPGHIRDGKPAAGFEHSPNLAEGPILVGHQVQHAIADDHVDRAVIDRQGLDFALAELDVSQATLFRIATGLGEHGVGHVHANHQAGRPDLAGREEAVEPGPAAEIEHGFARLNRGDRLRVAAGQAEIRPFRQRRQLGRRIAEADRQPFGVVGAAAERAAAGFARGHLGVLLLDHHLEAFGVGADRAVVRRQLIRFHV